MADENNDFTMIPVVSSQLAEVGYNPETQTMRIRFTKGQLYEYDNVPEQIYQGLMTAPSIGSFFNANCKWNFTYRRLE
jgi:hypothetical protein